VYRIFIFLLALAILNLKFTPEWILEWTDRLYEETLSHPFIDGLQHLLMIPVIINIAVLQFALRFLIFYSIFQVLMNKPAVRSLFQNQDWDLDAFRQSFVMDRSTTSVSFIEKAEDSSFEHFMEFLKSVFGKIFEQTVFFLL